LAFDASGNLYAAGLFAIHKFYPNGVRGDFSSRPGLSFDFALDSFGNLYSAASSSIQKFNAAGTVVQTINTGFIVDAVAVDSNDILYVGGRDNLSATIRRFSTDGTPLGIFYQFPAQIDFIDDLAIANVVPEPSSGILLVSVCIGLPLFRRTRSMLKFPSARCCE
jgi:hypothetical protein